MSLPWSSLNVLSPPEAMWVESDEVETTEDRNGPMVCAVRSVWSL